MTDHAAEDAERTAALREALKGDEVYVVHVDGRWDPVYVFGHREDAEAFAQAIWGEFREALPNAVIATPVCDHADARRLIEQEGGWRTDGALQPARCTRADAC